CRQKASDAASPARGTRPKYSVARSTNANSPPPLASHRNAGSMSSASACASASKAPGAGSANRSSTLAALIFIRLPDAVSTCSDVSLSARTVPALNAPSSSKKTCMGSGVAAGGGANYTVTPVRLQDRGLCCTMAPSIPTPESTMEFRRLGDSGLEVSVLCLGTMMFGDRTDASGAQRIIGSAFDAGVNFIDTADVYAKGASETIVGPALAANRRRWIL